LVCSLFGIYAISFLSDKRFDKKNRTPLIILVILWIVVVVINIALLLSWVDVSSLQYTVDGLRIGFIILISIFTAIVNGIYVSIPEKIPTTTVFFQMVCLIFYVDSISVTDTPLSIIIPIFSALVSIKLIKSLSTMFKPIAA